MWPVVPFAALSGLLMVFTMADDFKDVTTHNGIVRGNVLLSRLRREFFAFRGIPYAQPPIGPLRFKPPVLRTPWQGVWNATADAPMCIQKNYLLPNATVMGVEDCLYLNVYVPKSAFRDDPQPQDRLPVMVYIHGGGWFSGTGASYITGPQHLMDRDIVLVTFNYRLAALGFLSTGDHVAPGNNGLKDQVMVLQWVQQNIAAFTGDPQCVTIFGQSAGGASVHYHILSPMTNGLFHRAITESGTALDRWAWVQNPRPLVIEQATLVHCPTTTSEEMIACLQGVDANTLVSSGDSLHYWSIDPLTTYRPVIENGSNAYLSEDPFTLIKNGNFHFVPWINGVVGQEGTVRAVPILTNASLLEDLNRNFNALMPRLMELTPSTITMENLWRNISEFYFQNSHEITESNHQKFIDIYSDRSMIHGFYKTSILHTQAGHRHMYIYNFNYRGLYSYTSLFVGTTQDYGVSHCDELIYLFSSPVLFPPWPEGHPDLQVIDNLITLWTNFAKYGNPTPTVTAKQYQNKSFHGPGAMHHSGHKRSRVKNEACTNIHNLHWEPHAARPQANSSDLYYLDIIANPITEQGTLQFCMNVGLHAARMNYWESLPLIENVKSQEVYYLLRMYYIPGVVV